jgi:hypothetical protein
MSEKPKKGETQKHSKERREIIKAAATLSLLPYVAPIIKTFLVDGGLGMLAPQGQSARAQAVQAALAAGLRGQAAVQAVQNLVSP